MKKLPLIIASANAGKVREFTALLSDQAFDVSSLRDHAIGSPAETGLSFVENALIKARHAAAQTGHAALADDSGICVPKLKGAPGIYSARFAGPGATDADNNHMLLDQLKGAHERKAFYYCALVLIRHAEDPTPLIATGEWHGEILKHERGEGGFGYDPLFWLPKLGKSSAELSDEEKNRLSHRGLAMRALLNTLANSQNA